MNLKYTTILLVAMTPLLATGQAGAQASQTQDPDRGGYDRHGPGRMDHRRPHEQMGPERMVRMMSRRLELDESQTEQVQNIMAAAKPEFDALREKERANREATRELDVDDPDYGSKLQDLAAVSGELAASSVQLHGRIRSEIHAVLTPEQREQLAAAPERGRHHGPEHSRGGKPESPVQ